MGWTELREKGGGDSSQLKALLKETKANLEEICEMIDEMDGGSGQYGERRGMYGQRGGMYGQRDAWRIEREDDDYNERRGGRRY